MHRAQGEATAIVPDQRLATPDVLEEQEPQRAETQGQREPQRDRRGDPLRRLHVDDLHVLGTGALVEPVLRRELVKEVVAGGRADHPDLLALEVLRGLDLRPDADADVARRDQRAADAEDLGAGRARS